MGKETGRPAESGLHVHPLQEGASELGGPSEKQEVFKITAGESKEWLFLSSVFDLEGTLAMISSVVGVRDLWVVRLVMMMKKTAMASGV